MQDKLSNYKEALELACEEFDSIRDKIRDISDALISGQEKEALFTLGIIHSVCLYNKNVLEERLELGDNPQ